MATHLNDTSNTSFHSASNKTVDSDALTEFTNTMDLYLPPALFAIGFCCNILVIIVMNSAHFSNVSTSFYIRFTALLDNTSIVLVFPLHWVHVNYPQHIYRGPYSDIICKAGFFLGSFTSDAGIALTAAMSFERALAIKYPLHAPTFCTVKRARFVTFCILCLITALDGHAIVTASMAGYLHSYLCETVLDSEPAIYYVGKVAPVLNNLLLMVSFIIIIISNIIIIRNVNSSAKLRISSDIDSNYSKSSSVPVSNIDIAISDVQSSASVINAAKCRSSISKLPRNRNTRPDSRTASNKSRQLAIMLILDSLTIMICTIPFALTNFLVQYGIIRMEGSTEHFVQSMNLYLLYVNRCVNFFLYCISGERFRHTLIHLCARKRQSAARTLMYSVESLASSDIAGHKTEATLHKTTGECST